MPKSISLRLSDKEAKQLDEMAHSENRAVENRSEFIRLLLAREYNRSKGKGKPEASSYQTAFRIGRPWR